MAAVANHTLRVNLLGFTKDGAKVIAQTQDGKLLKVRCGCGDIYTNARIQILRARQPRRMLQCYECSCKFRAAGAKANAPKRARIKGQFASKLEA